MLDFSAVRLKHIIYHNVGNRSRDEPLLTSDNCENVPTGEEPSLLAFLLRGFQESTSSYYFDHPTDVQLNAAYIACNNMLNGRDDFIRSSVELAQLLYHVTSHPNIRPGVLCVALIENVIASSGRTHAVVLSKISSSDKFIRFSEFEHQIAAEQYQGASLKTAERSALIYWDPINSTPRIVLANLPAMERSYWISGFLSVAETIDTQALYNYYTEATEKFLRYDTVNLEPEKRAQLASICTDYLATTDSFDESEMLRKISKTDAELPDKYARRRKLIENDVRKEFPGKFDVGDSVSREKATSFKSIVKLADGVELHITKRRNSFPVIQKEGDERDGSIYYKIFVKQGGHDG